VCSKFIFFLKFLKMVCRPQLLHFGRNFFGKAEVFPIIVWQPKIRREGHSCSLATTRHGWYTVRCLCSGDDVLHTALYSGEAGITRQTGARHGRHRTLPFYAQVTFNDFFCRLTTLSCLNCSE